MSLLPFIEGGLDFLRSSKILNQHFGLGLGDEDLLTPCVPRRIRRLMNSPYYRTWNTRAAHKDEGSVVKADKDQFQVNLDVQQFTPDEITVKATGDNTITVEGKHEEKEDEHGFISRHFIRRYVLPKGHDINKTVSKLSSDGILTITAPKEKKNEVEYKEIPIIQTGKPSKAITDKCDDKMECENGDDEKSKKRKS